MEGVQLNDNYQDQINQLRREIERLSQVEVGRSQASSQPSRGSST